MLESLTKKQKIIFFIILLVMLIIIIYYIYSTIYYNNFSFSYENTSFNTNSLIETSDSETIFSTTTDEIEESNKIVVYVCGAVKENKVVTLKENSRICDAIDAAGGLTNDADLTNINLAYILEDGEKIYIPKKGENINIDSSTSETSKYSSVSSEYIKNSKININKATQTELETIPGVGPSTALKIINYRKENGKFINKEDIKNVSGIGDAKYEKIKNYISVK